MRLAAVVLLLMGGVSVFGCVSDAASTPTATATPTPAPTQSEYMVFTHSENGFAISYPRGWQASPPCCGQPGSLVIHPRDNDEVEVWVSDVLRGVPPAPSAREYLDGLLNETPLPKGYEVVLLEEMEVNGVQAVKHMYTFTDDRGQTIKAMEVLFKSGIRALQVACSAPSDMYATYAEALERIVRSFHLIY
jgi:hypothetical protein